MTHARNLTGYIPRAEWEWVDPAVLARVAAFNDEVVAFTVVVEAGATAGVIDFRAREVEHLIDLREPELSQTADHS